MSSEKARAVCVGEVRIELARGADGRFALSCGGDTFNTAVYLARAGLDVAFATALGDDPYSDSIVALASAEGVSSKLIFRVPGKLPPLCLVESGQGGERVVRYWGEEAPARELFERPDWMLVAQEMVAARLIYFSGITLSLYSNNGVGRFLALLEAARQQGAKVAFDGNFRPRGWKGDLSRTRAVFMEALKRVDIALPTFDDEAVLWGDPSPETTVARLQAFGIGEIVVKNGPNSALVATAGAQQFVPVPEVMVPVDPTAAGDGFNAGYLAARLTGAAMAEAAAAAHRLAGDVIRHPGALVPRADAAMH
ncbi:MAG TPA: sugar kinase [Xanthobacteraceae bacterium]|jgi:2-dehydro-3-deoxygluconokinase|nr:sugar kinase [Xanthobacteraceae bacterium]